MGDGRLGEEVLAALDAQLAAADAARRAGYPGDRQGRRPVHTCYVPADRYDAATHLTWGKQALAAMDAHAAGGLAAAVGLDGPPGDLDGRVRAKLAAEPVEDLRVDFEDGYGRRPDEEEDGAAVAAGIAIGRSLGRPGGPFRTGVRIKSLEPDTRRRAVRTLDLCVGAAVEEAGELPGGFVVTLPKVTAVAQVDALGSVCRALEQAYGLPDGRLGVELQIEAPQAVLGADGRATVAAMVHAAAGRCLGLHYGTYDYSAALGVPAGYQSGDHPVADHAKAVMLVAAAGTGVDVVDGSSNVVPVGGPDAVLAAWRLHARLVRRALEGGIGQGWDLHPAQLVSRYAATYAFYRQGAAAAADRAGVLEEPATARALARFLRRGLDCGALDRETLDRLGRYVS